MLHHPLFNLCICLPSHYRSFLKHTNTTLLTNQPTTPPQSMPMQHCCIIGSQSLSVSSLIKQLYSIIRPHRMHYIYAACWYRCRT